MEQNTAIQGDYVVMYSTKFGGYEWEQIEFPWTAPVSKVMVAASGTSKQLSVQVSILGAQSIEEARSVTDPIAAQVVNRLAYHLNFPIGNPHYIGASVTMAHANGTYTSSTVGVARIGIRPLGESCQILGQERRDQIKNAIEGNALPGESLYTAYLAALSCTDTIAKFLVLYQLLMLHYKDDQKKVDSFIRNIEPGTPTTQTFPIEKKNSPTVYLWETVYSRLRNQVGHNRHVPIEQTRAEMEQHEQGLMRLARKLIDNKS